MEEGGEVSSGKHKRKKSKHKDRGESDKEGDRKRSTSQKKHKKKSKTKDEFDDIYWVWLTCDGVGMTYEIQIQEEIKGEWIKKFKNYNNNWCELQK